MYADAEYPVRSLWKLDVSTLSVDQIYPPGLRSFTGVRMVSAKDQARVEGGRKAAQTVRERYGKDYFKVIGSSGGRVTSTRYGNKPG